MSGALQIAATLHASAFADIQSALDPAADQAQAIHGIWQLMLWICVPMYLLVMSAIVFVLWRARRQRRAGPDVATVSERNLFSGLGVWIIVVMLGLTVLTAASYV